MKKLHCPRRGKFCRQRVASPKQFAKGSFRTIRRGKRLLVVACPKGHWSGRKCKVGMKVQTVLIPKRLVRR